MKEKSIPHIRNIKIKGCISRKSILNSFFISILKFNLALALLFIIAFSVVAVDAEINQGRLVVTNGFMAGINSAGDFIDYDVNDNTYFKAPGSTNSIFFEVPDGNPRMVVSGVNGNVGIGTTSPSEKLEVNGNVKADAFYYSSDVSLKKDIQKIKNALDKIQQLEGVSFKWKENDKQSLGIIAQDLEEVFPELVTTDKVTGLKSVEYGNLVAPLIEAVKEQQKRIEEQQKKIEELSAAIAELRG